MGGHKTNQDSQRTITPALRLIIRAAPFDYLHVGQHLCYNMRDHKVRTIMQNSLSTFLNIFQLRLLAGIAGHQASCQHHPNKHNREANPTSPLADRCVGIAKRIPPALWATGGWVSRSESHQPSGRQGSADRDHGPKAFWATRQHSSERVLDRRLPRLPVFVCFEITYSMDDG